MATTLHPTLGLWSSSLGTVEAAQARSQSTMLLVTSDALINRLIIDDLNLITVVSIVV